MIIKKPSHRKSKARTVALITLGLVVLAGLTLFALEYYHVINLFNNQDTSVENSDQPKIDYNKPSQDQINTGNNIKNGSSDQTTPSNGDFTVSISSLTSDSDYLHLRALITGVISSSGTCELTIQDANGNVQKTLAVNTFAMPSYTTCQGFDINKSELTKGNLKVILNVTINGKTSTADREYKLE